MNITNLRRPFAAWLWLGALLWVTNVLAAPVPTSLAPSIDLSPMVELLEDRDGTLTMADVRSAALADRFQSGPPRIGHSTSAWWLRLRVRTDSHQGGTWWLDSGNRMLQELDVFSPDETGAYRQQSASSTRVFADRPLPTANFVFPLTLPPGSETAIYLRARSTSYVPTNLTPVLWQPDAYQRLEQQHHRWMHFYLGLALALATLNLFLYLSLRDTIYLRYVLSVIGVVFSADSVPSGFGLFFQYFWPESPHFQQVAWAIGITCVYLAVRFLASFVEWSRLAPRLDRAGKVFFGLIGVWAALIIFGVLDTAPAQWGGRLLQIGFVLYFTWAFSSLIWFAWQGDRNHRLALIAWGPITLMGIINPLLQVLRLRTDQMLPPIMTGSALEMLLMSLILADRFNQARKEKERAQAALVAGLQQSERELEGKVADRTAEVKAQAAQLDEWNHRKLSSA